MFSYKGVLAWGGGLMLVCAVSWIFAGLKENPHLADTLCSNCHLAGKQVDPAQAHKLVASQELLCGVCHASVKRMSHPSGFAPRGKLAAEYPLDWKGDMTCSTCHEVHGTKPGLLRGDKRGKDLCLSCHDSGFFDTMKDAGISLQQTGHLSSNDLINKGVAVIDRYSLQCIGCHDSRSDARGVNVGRNGILRHASGAANHPIGITYPAFAPNGEFRPKNMLSKFILLPDGKLSCVSCHQVYKKDHGQLVVVNERSSLCVQCHNL